MLAPQYTPIQNLSLTFQVVVGQEKDPGEEEISQLRLQAAVC